MIGPEVVDLFLEDARPEVLANKFHQVQFVFKLGILASQLFDKTISGVKANVFLMMRFTLFDNSTIVNYLYLTTLKIKVCKPKGSLKVITLLYANYPQFY